MGRVSLLLLVLCLLLSSCTGLSPFTDDLLKPPRLTAEQKEIEDALLSSVNTGDLTFKYPKSGEHRSAFIFQDIDGDGLEEALVFYVTPASDSTFLSVLDRLPDGRWQSPNAIAGAAKNVEFISFAYLTDESRCDILVGWSDPLGQQKLLNVYSYLDGRLESRFEDGAQSYETYLAANLDEDPLSELILISRDQTDRVQSHWLYLYSYSDYSLQMMHETPLSDYMMDCKGITTGKISQTDPRAGIFIDEITEEGMLVTEVFVVGRAGTDKAEMPPTNPVSEKRLAGVIWEGMASPADISPQASALTQTDPDEAPVDAPTLYDLTRRPDKTDICSDINGDGVIEIPTGRLMPGYENYDLSEQFFLTQYKRLQDNAFVEVYSAAINRDGGYQVKFPSAWVDHVTIVNEMENNEWRFIEYNSQLLNNPLEDWSSELMRIRVVSHKDYQDRSIENYTVLAVRGAFTYYGYIPETATGTLSITMDQLKTNIFSLIERKGVFES